MWILPAPLLQGAVHLPLGVPGGGGRALVVELFALAQAHRQLDVGPAEIDRQGHQSVAVLLHLGVEPENLPLVHQQAAGAHRVPVEDIPLLIGAHMEAVDHHLPVLDDAEGVLQIHIAHADGFDLRAAELDAGLILLLHEIVVVGLAVGRDLLDCRVVQGRASFPEGDGMPGRENCGPRQRPARQR